MRPAGIVGRIRLLFYPLIPSVAITIERAHAVAIDPDIITSEDKRSRLVLIADIQRVVQPVLNVSTPLQWSSVWSLTDPVGVANLELSSNINLNILQPCNFHNGINVVRSRLELYPASAATSFECLNDGRSIICGVGSRGLDNTGLSDGRPFACRRAG